MKHLSTTPLPFKARRIGYEYILLDDNENTIGHLLFASEELRQTREKQALYIVHATNAYPKLIEALRFTMQGSEHSTIEYQSAEKLLQELGEEI